MYIVLLSMVNAASGSENNESLLYVQTKSTGGYYMSYLSIKKVTIEGMHNVKSATYDFNKLTYLHGKNGAGKSTVMEAIQLALLGYIPGKGKTKELIFRHANSHTMAITLVLINNETNEEITIIRTWKQSPKGISSDVKILPVTYVEENLKHWVSNIELPIFNFNEFVGMTANKLKDWFISFIPKEEAEVNWEEVLTKHVQGNYFFNEKTLKEVLANLGNPDAGVDGVRQVNSYLKQLLSFKKTELDRVASTIQSLVFYDDIDGVDNETELMRQRSELIQQRDMVTRWISTESQNIRVKEQLANCITSADSLIEDAEYIELKQRISDRQDEIYALNDTITSHSVAIANMQAEMKEKQRIINGRGICPYSNNECESVKATIAVYVEDVKALEMSIADSKKIISQAKMDEDCLNRVNNADVTKMHQIQSVYDQKNRLTALLVDNFDIDRNWLEIDFESLIANIDNTIVKIRANAKYNQLIETLTQQKYQIELDIECVKAWAKLTDANGMQSQMMSNPFDKFAESIDKYLKYTMGEDIHAAFYIVEKANSFSFGITRNGDYVPFDLLSSGEKCLYTLALMMAINLNCTDYVSVIMVDDLLDHLDDDNIDKLFDSLVEVPNTQFIFAGVKDTMSSAPTIITIKGN